MEENAFDLSVIGSHIFQLVVAFVLALPIGLNREQSRWGTLGLRTFPLVAMASCGYVLLGKVVLATELAAQARIFQGLITGIGFLGGGAIIKQGTDVQGTATAAAIWSTAAIGAATAYSRYEIAVALALTTFFVLFGMSPVKKQLNEEDASSED